MNITNKLSQLFGSEKVDTKNFRAEYHFKPQETPPDKFIRVDADTTDGGYAHETENLNFKKVKIKFYPEDVAKMNSMSFDEQIRYKQFLKSENKYIIENNPMEE